MKRITTNITHGEYDALHQLAAVTGLPWAELLRRAIDQYLHAPDVIRETEPHASPDPTLVPVVSTLVCATEEGD